MVSYEQFTKMTLNDLERAKFVQDTNGYIAIRYLQWVTSRGTAVNTFGDLPPGSIMGEARVLYWDPVLGATIVIWNGSIWRELLAESIGRTATDNTDIAGRLENKVIAGTNISVTKTGTTNKILTISTLADMAKSTYDPTNKNADAFSMWNMVETATKKILTDTERTNLGNQSNTNTWDETTATIKTKLGITTLSWSNTGDEDVTSIKTKLWITTLSGSNTGDQIISDTTIALTDITTNDASSTKHGFLPKLTNTGTKFLRDDGTYQTVVVQQAFDAVVATSWGDYTTVTAAIAAGKRNILVRAGWYTESSWEYTVDSNLSIIGEWNVVINFNNISSNTYIGILWNLYVRGIKFAITLNSTATTFIKNYTWSWYQKKTQTFETCTFTTTESASNTFLCSTNTNTQFNNCYMEFTNTTNAIYLTWLYASYIWCTISGGKINTFQWQYTWCKFSWNTIVVSWSSQFDNCIFSNMVFSWTLWFATTCTISSTITWTLSLGKINACYISADALDISLTGNISWSYISTGWNIIFNGWLISASELNATWNYINNASFQMTWCIVRAGTAFALSTYYNVITGNRFISKWYTFTVNTWSIGNIITSNIQIGTITDSGTSTIMANNS